MIRLFLVFSRFISRLILEFVLEKVSTKKADKKSHIIPGQQHAVYSVDVKKDRRWQKTRETFLRTGFDLFGRFGVEGVRVDAIIAEANVSKQTFYNHFKDREAFLLELRIRSRETFEAAVGAANASETDPARRLVRGVAVYAQVALSNPLHAQFVVSALMRPDAREHFLDQGVERDLADGLQTGRLKFCTVSGAVVFVRGVVQGLVGRILQGIDRAGVIVMCQEVLALLLRGFSCDPAEAELLASQVVDQVIRSTFPN